MLTPARLASLLTALLTAPTLSGCDKSCEKLRAHLCDNAQYQKDNPRHCEQVFGEDGQATHYTAKGCQSALDHLNLR